MGIIADALARQAARPEPRRIDYDRMNRVMPSQKAALTRAVNAWRKAGGNIVRPLDPAYIGTVAAAENIARVCKAAVAEWNAIGAWPDNWHRWQVALDDALPWNQSIDLRDL